MLSTAGKYFTDTLDMFNTDFFKRSALNAAASTAQNTTQSVIQAQQKMGLINTNSEAFGILKKVVGIGAAGVVVIGSAYYIGYQVARKRHRFHTREADKNDQVHLFFFAKNTEIRNRKTEYELKKKNFYMKGLEFTFFRAENQSGFQN